MPLTSKADLFVASGRVSILGGEGGVVSFISIGCEVFLISDKNAANLATVGRPNKKRAKIAATVRTPKVMALLIFLFSSALASLE